MVQIGDVTNELSRIRGLITLLPFLSSFSSLWHGLTPLFISSSNGIGPLKSNHNGVTARNGLPSLRLAYPNPMTIVHDDVDMSTFAILISWNFAMAF